MTTPTENTPTEATFTMPESFIATGSEKTITISPMDWDDLQGFTEYLLTYASGVILQRASAGKNDDKEKADKAVQAAIDRLQKGIVPSGGGFTKLSPQDYALKEVLTHKKVKFEKGETVSQVISRLGLKLTLKEKDEAKDVYAERVLVTITQLMIALQEHEVYQSALKARLSKTKKTEVETGLLSQL